LCDSDEAKRAGGDGSRFRARFLFPAVEFISKTFDFLSRIESLPPSACPASEWKEIFPSANPLSSSISEFWQYCSFAFWNGRGQMPKSIDMPTEVKDLYTRDPESLNRYDQLAYSYLSERSFENESLFSEQCLAGFQDKLKTTSPDLLGFGGDMLFKSRIDLILSISSKFAEVCYDLDFEHLPEHQFMKLRAFVSFNAKKAYLDHALDKSSGFSNEIVIRFNRGVAIKAAHRAYPECARDSLLGQATLKVRQTVPLENMQAARPDTRPWKCEFHGEGSTDAGGLFRELLTDFTTEFFNQELCGLVILCPNGRFSM